MPAQLPLPATAVGENVGAMGAKPPFLVRSQDEHFANELANALI